jgi:hypothetical protein
VVEGACVKSRLAGHRKDTLESSMGQRSDGSRSVGEVRYDQGEEGKG